MNRPTLRGRFVSETAHDGHGTRSDHTTPRFSIAAPLHYGGYDWTFGPNNAYPTGTPYNDGTHGDPRTAAETRPVSVSMVWIPL